MRAKLFLLKPDFTDSKSDNKGKVYYCPQCAMIEGIIKYYPHLTKMIEIHYVDFTKPRQAIVELIGEENQNCPALIIDNASDNDKYTSYFNKYDNKLFVNSTELITRYFTENLGPEICIDFG